MPKGRYERTLQRPRPDWWSVEGEVLAELDYAGDDWVCSRIPTNPLSPVELRAARVRLAQEMLTLIVHNLGQPVPAVLQEALLEAKHVLQDLMYVCITGEEPHSNSRTWKI